MALPSWTFELLRRGISDVARRANEPETREKLKTHVAELKSQAAELTGQASEMLQDLPESAARGLDKVMRSAESGKEQVQTWARKHTAMTLPMLNASGTLLHEFGTGVAISEAVLDAGYDVLRGDALAGPAADQRIDQRLQRLKILSEDRSIAIAANFSAAVASLSLIGKDRLLVVHRSQAVRVGSATPLPELLGGLVPGVREVGAINDCRASDFDSLDAFCSITADAGGEAIQLLDFGGRDAIQACLLPIGSVHPVDGMQLPHASELLEEGANLVILPGNGLCGGPECGVLIGDTKLIEQITAGTNWAALRSTDAVAAMMCVALTEHQSNAETPIESLISTSEENLKARAERLATRISASDDVLSTQVAATPASVVDGSRWKLPSRQVLVKHETKTAEELHDQLLDSLPAVLTSVVDDCIAIDLRWLSPSDDAKVAECF